MLRVELGHPKAALGRPPKLFGDGACSRDWMGGDPDALRVRGIHGFSPPVFSMGSPSPMENEDETKTHLQVGCQGERGMTGASPQP